MQKAGASVKWLSKGINTLLNKKEEKKEYLYSMTSRANTRLIFKATVIEISYCESLISAS